MTEGSLDKVFSHCNICGRKTNHLVSARMKTAEVATSQRGDEFPWEGIHELITCMGCESVAYRSSEQNAPWYTHFDIDGDPWTYYPPRMARAKPTWLRELSREEGCSEIYELMTEVYNAMQMGSGRLAMMGIRALFDLLIQNVVGDQGSFARGLDKLVSNGNLSQKNRDFVEAAVEAGHASTHRGYKPSEDELESAMDIVENVLHATYVLQKRADQLRSSTPPRKAPKP